MPVDPQRPADDQSDDHPRPQDEALERDVDDELPVLDELLDQAGGDMEVAQRLATEALGRAAAGAHPPSDAI